MNIILSLSFNYFKSFLVGSKYPTANLFLPELWNIKSTIDAKVNSEEEWLSAMATKMQRKFQKYWGGSNLLLSIAALLDPRNKMRMINFTYKEMYDAYEADIQKRLMQEALYELYKEYVDAEASSREQRREARNQLASSSSSGGVLTSEDVQTGREKFDIEVEKEDDGIGQELECELDTYLGEKVFRCQDKSVPFDVIAWWKANSLKFKVLSRMAVEILSIPITTVASESTFSAGGRVIDSYRASLGIDTIEVLLCGND